MHNILISTECVADLPLEIVEKFDIGIIYYTIKTDMGEFRDTDEITASNVMEYMIGGKKKALSLIPTSKDYEAFFRKGIEKYDEIVHISISSGVSEAYDNAKKACQEMGAEGERVHVIDSKHLSSGQGLLVIEAAKLKQNGKTSREIIEYVEHLKDKVSTSFLAYNADYLYYNGKVPEKVMKLCQEFNLHPVLGMDEGKLTVKGVYIGKYDRAARNYVRKTVKNSGNIRKDNGFVTYAGCSQTGLEHVRDDVQKIVGFHNIYEQQASAAISSNCGPNTFGILFIKNE